MNISRTELEQMSRDGRGRTSVIKELAQRELSRIGQAANAADSVLMRGRWVHYLTSSCTHGKPPEFLRIQHSDGTEQEIELR